MSIFYNSSADIFYSYSEVEDSLGTVTLLNGYTRSHSDFLSLSRFLNQAKFSVLLLDNRGAGETVVQADQPFTIQDMAQDVIDLWDHLGISQSSVVGISMGGLIAQSLALDCGQINRISAICLISTMAEPKYIDQRSQQWTSDKHTNLVELSRYVAPLFLEKNKPLMMMMAQKMAENTQLVPSALLQRNALKNYQRSPQDFKKLEDVPVLILHGELDQIIPQVAGQELKKYLPHAELKIAEGNGHLLLAENIQFVRANLLQFLNTCLL